MNRWKRVLPKCCRQTGHHFAKLAFRETSSRPVSNSRLSNGCIFTIKQRWGSVVRPHHNKHCSRLKLTPYDLLILVLPPPPSLHCCRPNDPRQTDADHLGVCVRLFNGLYRSNSLYLLFVVVLRQKQCYVRNVETRTQSDDCFSRVTEEDDREWEIAREMLFISQNRCSFQW